MTADTTKILTPAEVQALAKSVLEAAGVDSREARDILPPL